MELGAPVFDAMNETDVREEVIAPLIKKLGYRTGTEHNVIRELSLTYSRVQLGREKASDPPLRGKADYILEAGRRVRWVIEAKAPAAAMDSTVEAQAWSYANHPEVRAIYFLVTNGRQFRLYATNRGPDGPPILEFTYEEIPQRIAAISNTLSPTSILRDYPDVVVDDGEPLGPGLRSTLRISSGRLRVHQIDPAIAPVAQMTVSVVGGSACRRPDGGIAISYQTEIAVNVLQAMNEQIGLNIVELVTNDSVLSTDVAHPTAFRGTREMLIPKGMPTIDLNTWQHVIAPVDFRVAVALDARGHLVGQKFAGEFTSTMRMSLVLPDAGPKVFNFRSAGTFELTLV